MEVFDLMDQGPMDYQTVWDLQRDIHAAVRDGTRPDTLVLVEHTSVYTAGRRTAQADRPMAATPIPVIDVDRGGRITWHGPGQLVAYPIVRLAEPVDPVKYVRALEAALVGVCNTYGVRGMQVAGRSGVWVRPAAGPDRKVAAIGARIAGGVTMHGVALNVCNSLDAYRSIVACGIADADVTTLAAEAHLPLTPAAVAPALVEGLRRELAALLAVPDAVPHRALARSHPQEATA